VCFFDRKAEILRARVALSTTREELGDCHTRAFRFAVKQFGADAAVGDLKVGMLAYLTDWARRKRQGRLDECVSRFLLRCAAHILQAGIKDTGEVDIHVFWGDGFDGTSTRGSGSNFPIADLKSKISRHVTKVWMVSEYLSSKVCVRDHVMEIGRAHV
jgi:hypothetical protein